MITICLLLWGAPKILSVEGMSHLIKNARSIFKHCVYCSSSPNLSAFLYVECCWRCPHSWMVMDWWWCFEAYAVSCETRQVFRIRVVVRPTRHTYEYILVRISRYYGTWLRCTCTYTTAARISFWILLRYPLLSRSFMRDGWCIQLHYQSS